MKKTLLFLLYLMLCWSTAFATERGIKRVEIKTVSGETVGLYEESHALVIGVSDYTAGWPDLESVPDDIKAVSQALEKHNFHVVQVLNPTKKKLTAAFTEFIDNYGYNQDNRLLFYYSGHGYTKKVYERNTGYLVPRDAPDPNQDSIGFSQKALQMSQILAWAKQIEAKHAIFLFDSCFSGSVLKERSLLVPRQIQTLTAKPVRQFISAGSEGQTVPAQSVFRPSFTRGIRGEADLDKDGYVTGTELGLYLQRQVANYDTGQTPQFGKIKDPLYDEGDFVFVLPQAALDLGSTSKTAVSVPKIAAPPETSGLQLEALIQQAESQEQAKEELKQVKAQWAAWQARMQKDFDRAQTFERKEITPDLKIEPWRQFLEVYASNNPFGEKDENLRSKAQGRLKYWRSETKLLAQKNAALASGTASVDLSNTPEISAPPANPDAEKIWNKYQLGLKRKLPKFAEKYLRKLLAEHPESGYAIQFKVAELQAELDKNGLSVALIVKIEILHDDHPRNPDLRKLIVQASPFLLRRVDRFIEGGDLDFAEQALSFAARWNVPGTELSRRRQQIQQIRISSLIKDADKIIKQGNAKNAEQKLNAALRLGADPTKIEELRRGIPLKLVKYLIETEKFEKAGELLLELELEGDYELEISELYILLLNKTNQFKWDEILVLIEQNKFSTAEVKIIEWEKNDNAPSNLPKLKKYLQKEEQIFLGREIAQHQDYSEETAIQIDREVKKLVLEGDKVARTILEGQREELIRLAEALLEYETLNFEEVGLLMKGEKIQRDVGPETSDQPEPIPEEKEKEEETGQAIPSLVNPDDSPAPA